MDTISKSKWRVRGAAIVIFLLGFTAGALALNAYKRWDRTGAGLSRQDRFDRMLDSLQLNADQKTQVHQILGIVETNCRLLEKSQSLELAKFANKRTNACKRC